ncbi:MAG: glutaminyl-peptide cyclotransferase [Parachlamydia sp.]|nr:glutaminyl-peptide cyclotransferase [Parachlamydia sp.]
MLLWIVWFILSAPLGAVETLFPTVVRTIAHDSGAFTQGLAYDDQTGKLYESTGLYHLSTLREIDLKEGKIARMASLPPHCFGEGIALAGSRLWQITWKEKKAFCYRLSDFQVMQEFPYQGEGWGLCYDEDLGQIWMSNGSDILVRRSPETFEIVGTLPVRMDGKPVPLLNDLACANKALYANVWGKSIILRIDKEKGEVTALFEAKNLVPKEINHSDAVMNGIAFRKDTHTFFLTGKWWPYLYEVRLN